MKSDCDVLRGLRATGCMEDNQYTQLWCSIASHSYHFDNQVHKRSSGFVICFVFDQKNSPDFSFMMDFSANLRGILNT